MASFGGWRSGSGKWPTLSGVGFFRVMVLNLNNKRGDHMRKWLVGAVAAAGVLAVAVPAQAAPSNAPSSTFFPGVLCVSNTTVLVTDFVINGQGNWTPAHTEVGVIKPVSIILTGTDPVTGEELFSEVLIKNNADTRAEFLCTGSNVQLSPTGEPTIISFLALARI